MARGGAKDCFPLVMWMDVHKIICAAQIKFGEESGRAEMFEDIWNQWQGIWTLHCDLTEASIINAQTKASPFFSIKKNPAKAEVAEGRMYP